MAIDTTVRNFVIESLKGFYERFPKDILSETQFSDLSSMISEGTLVPGAYYRITDYITTTNSTDSLSTDTYTAVNAHAFDLVVTAISESELDCKAFALPHENDTYYTSAGADLTKWQVWYDINNDTTKYAWAKSIGGKGVIYRLIDEWGNDCPYDFKNIQFKRKLTDGVLDTANGTNTWVYTFNAWNEDDSVCEDASLITMSLSIDDGYNHCLNNIVNSSIDYNLGGPIFLNNIVFLNVYSIDGIEYFSCYSNTFGYGCNSNTFGNECNSNTFGNTCYYNTFGNNCYNNTLGNTCFSNTFGNTCYYNTFGDGCRNNTFGNYCYSNTFGNTCYYNTFGNNCYNNTLGNGCNHIIFGNSSNQGGTYCQYNIVENGNQYIRMYQTTGTANNYNQLQNVYIAQGVNNTNTWYDISTIARNLPYRTTVARLSDGTIRIYNEDEYSIQSDWNQRNSSASDYLKNMPEVFRNPSGNSGVSVLPAVPDGTVIERVVQDYDGNWYDGVVINNHIWLKQNLRVTHNPSGVAITFNHVGNDSSNDIVYGLLYNWDIAMNGESSSNTVPSGVQGIAPFGWHIPSKAEWEAFTTYVGQQSQYILDNNSTYIAKALASKEGWNVSTGDYTPGKNPENNDTTNFSVYPAGIGTSSSTSFLFNREARITTSTEANDSNFYYLNLTNESASFSFSNIAKTYKYSVRCVCNISASEWLANRLYLKLSSTGMVWNMLSAVAESGSYNDLTNTPTIPTTVASLTGDVDITSPSDNQILQYDDASSKWVNADIPTELPSLTNNAGKVLTVNSGATGTEWTTPTSSLAGLSDTTITTPTDGQALIYDNTTSKWVNGAAGASITKRVWTTTA